MVRPRRGAPPTCGKLQMVTSKQSPDTRRAFKRFTPLKFLVEQSITLPKSWTAESTEKQWRGDAAMQRSVAERVEKEDAMGVKGVVKLAPRRNNNTAKRVWNCPPVTIVYKLFLGMEAPATTMNCWLVKSLRKLSALNFKRLSSLSVAMWCHFPSTLLHRLHAPGDSPRSAGMVQKTREVPLALMLVTRSQSNERQAPWPSLRAMVKSRQRMMLVFLRA